MGALLLAELAGRAQLIKELTGAKSVTIIEIESLSGMLGTGSCTTGTRFRTSGWTSWLNR